MILNGYQPITYYNDIIKQKVGVLYDPKTGDIKSDGSSVSDALTDPSMAPILDMTRKSVEQKYVSDMTPALQRPDALDMEQTSRPAPNMRADALDLPQTSKNFDLRENVPVLYSHLEEENVGVGLEDYYNLEKPAARADLTSPMPTGARLDPYMDIPKVADDAQDGTFDADAVLNEGNEFGDYTLSNATQPVSYENERYNSLPLQNNQDDPVNDMVAGENLFPYTRVPDGHHRMRDGSIMADSEMKEDGVLGNNGKAPSNNKGVLNTDTTSSNDRKGSVVSGNARGSMMPFAKINRNEALMRIGGAIVGGSSQGFSGAMKAATDEFGNIQDANRKAETDAFNKAEATRLAEERIAALKAKADAKKTDNASLGDLRFGISKLQNGLEMIQNGDKNLTGVNAGAIFSRLYGKAVGSEAEAQRLFLKELGLDAIMKRVSQTKGAISNAEMKLFAQSAPDINSQEIVWESWIKRQIQMSNILINRLETGGSVDPNASLSDTMPSVKIDMGTTTTDNNAMLNEADAIIGL